MKKILTGFILTSTSFFALAQEIRINEIVNSNSTGLTDSEGTFPDWIELYNPGEASVSLLNWSLTDDMDEPTKWTFPDTEIAAGEFLVVLASGKNLTGDELHTNFKLANEGEYLALINNEGTIVSVFDPIFAETPTDHSLSFLDGAYISTSTPTPGEANTLGNEVTLPSPNFSHEPGFYEETFQLQLTSELADANIHFTLDGSTPNSSSQTYTSPISVSTTTVVRAMVSKSGNVSYSVTRTYLFLADVINQAAEIPGYPTDWSIEQDSSALADYEMDPKITTDEKYADKMIDALKSIPTISLVTDKENLFSTEYDSLRGGIYIFTGAPGDERGKGWERPASIELIGALGNHELQVNCTVELHGGHSRLPWKSAKHSFRISFKNDQGPGKLRFPFFGEDPTNEFEHIILRAGFNNTMAHWSSGQRSKDQLVRDLWMKETQRAMGQPSGHGFLAHLYINGIYWGVYNPTERINDDFMESYFGGDKEDYDVMKDYTEVAAGTDQTWNQMMEIANQDISDMANYHKLLGLNEDGSNNELLPALLDPVNLADYIILNFYAANQDWDHHNWIAGNNRTDWNQGFIFFCWDSENVLNHHHDNIVRENNFDTPSGLFQKLINNETFLDLFYQRVQLHCTGEGVLSPESATNRYKTLTDMAELPFITESARWGDHYSQEGFTELYTLENFNTVRDYLINTYFPERATVFIDQIEWFQPRFRPPTMYVNESENFGDELELDDIISFTSNSAEIYYSLDGTDPINQPRFERGMYSGPFSLKHSSSIIARGLTEEDWSDPVGREVYLKMDRSPIKVTEIHYHPLPEDGIQERSLEFLELKNTGSDTIDLGGVSLSGAIRFEFPIGSQFGPDQFMVLASNSRSFEARYGFEPDFRYGGLLSNEEDSIILSDYSDSIFLKVTYQSSSPWPERANGTGYSLIPRKANPAGAQNNPQAWTTSYLLHGSPGREDEYYSLSNDEIGSLQIYPNPAANKVHISFPNQNAAQTQITIYSLTGQVVYTMIMKPGLYELDLSHLSSGTYLLQATSPGESWAKKLILNHWYLRKDF